MPRPSTASPPRVPPTSSWTPLNDVTVSALTLDQAKSEVADLETHIEQNGKNVLAYRARAAFLQQSTYKDPRESKYVSYNPDTQQMVASLGGEEYLFEKVPPSSAETLVKSWPNVKATQPYTDDSLHTRTLVLDPASISVSGASRSAIGAIAHAEAEVIVAKSQRSRRQTRLLLRRNRPIPRRPCKGTRQSVG